MSHSHSSRRKRIKRFKKVHKEHWRQAWTEFIEDLRYSRIDAEIVHYPDEPTNWTHEGACAQYAHTKIFGTPPAQSTPLQK